MNHGITSHWGTLDAEITNLFLEVLLVCDELNLIGKELFAIDGVKLPSNASKELSGTKEDFIKKKEKMEKVIRQIITRHKETDGKVPPYLETEQIHPQRKRGSKHPVAPLLHGA